MMELLEQGTSERFINDDWQQAIDGESSSDFCDRMGWKTGDVVDILAGLEGLTLDGRYVRLRVERARILALHDKPEPHYGCDVRVAYLGPDGIVQFESWRNMTLTGFWPWRQNLAKFNQERWPCRLAWRGAPAQVIASLRGMRKAAGR